MPSDVAAVFDDPHWMFLRYDGDFAQFVYMTREACRDSIFFDHRIEPARNEVLRIPIDPLFDHLQRVGFTPPRIRFIHHFAQSGSTLLARALDGPDNLVVREPLHLRQVGVWKGASAAGLTAGQLRALLEFSLAMLGKRFASESSLIVKGNVPISLLADGIEELDPGQTGILLYFPLEDYCAAVLRTSKHRQWLTTVVEEIGLGGDPMVGNVAGFGPPQQAAALWYSMIKRFERLVHPNPRLRTLDANALFERPGEAIAAASSLLEAGISPAEASNVAKGPLFSTYSKNPAVPYDPALRIERREEAKSRLAQELLEARRWVDRRAEQFGLPAKLGSALLGDSPALV